MFVQKPQGILQLDLDYNPATRENQYRILKICTEIEEAIPLEFFDCPPRNFKSWLETDKKIRYPVPEKEFDYWMGRYLFELRIISNRNRQYGIIDGKMIFS